MPEVGNFLQATLLEEAYVVAKEKHVGPVWTVWKALEEAECFFLSWCEFIRRDGVTMNLKEVAPGMVRKYYLEDVRNAKYDSWWFDLSMKGAKGKSRTLCP